MIESVKIDENGYVYFSFENNRIITVVDKIAQGLLYLHFGEAKYITKSSFLFVTQLNQLQIAEMASIKWEITQKQRFRHHVSAEFVYFIINEVPFYIGNH